jgi:hypothetical protein
MAQGQEYGQQLAVNKGAVVLLGLVQLGGVETKGLSVASRPSLLQQPS